MKSILTEDTTHCIVCGRIADHCHHVFEGPDKAWSENFDLMIPMCETCHRLLHDNQRMNEYYKRLCQAAWQKKYPELKWQEYFRKNYL